MRQFASFLIERRDIKMEREQIRNEIIPDLEKAWENPSEVSYWMKKIPMMEEYDEDVHQFIISMRYAIMQKDREYYDSVIDDLIEHYFHNQISYGFLSEDEQLDQVLDGKGYIEYLGNCYFYVGSDSKGTEDEKYIFQNYNDDSCIRVSRQELLSQDRYEIYVEISGEMHNYANQKKYEEFNEEISENDLDDQIL